MVSAARAYFRDVNAAREYINKVAYYAYSEEHSLDMAR